MDLSTLHPLYTALLFFIAVNLFIVIGYFIGQLHKSADSNGGALSSLVGAMLGLVAFILGLTFSISANRFDARKALVLEEANAIGTLKLRADFLDAERKTNFLALLQDYLIDRTETPANSEILQQKIKQANLLLTQMWGIASQVAIENNSSETIALLIDSLNQVIDLNTSRTVVITKYRIPPVIWLTLFLIMAISMLSVGYLFSKSRDPNPLISLALATAFSLVTYLIADLDNPHQGLIRVSQSPIQDLL